jgi:hypothetical protein
MPRTVIGSSPIRSSTAAFGLTIGPTEESASCRRRVVCSVNAHAQRSARWLWIRPPEPAGLEPPVSCVVVLEEEVVSGAAHLQARWQRLPLEPGTPRFSVVRPNVSNWAQIPGNKRLYGRQASTEVYCYLRTFSVGLGTEIGAGTRWLSASGGHASRGLPESPASARRPTLRSAGACSGELFGETLYVAASFRAVLEHVEPAGRDRARRAGARARDRAGQRSDRVGVAAAAHREGDRLLDGLMDCGCIDRGWDGFERRGAAGRRSNAFMRSPRPRGRGGSSTAARAGYFLACSKYGLVPEAWSVTSTTRSISETVWVIATSMPWLRVTVAMPQP